MNKENLGSLRSLLSPGLQSLPGHYPSISQLRKKIETEAKKWQVEADAASNSKTVATPGSAIPALPGKLRNAAILMALRPAEIIENDQENSIYALLRSCKIILTRRSGKLRVHAGEISFPGGSRDEGELPIETALRESHEEIDLVPKDVLLVGGMPGKFTFTGFHIEPVIGIISPRTRLTPFEDEVEEIIEIPLSVILDPNSFSEHQLEWRGVTRPYLELHHDGHRVWGATARLLKDFSETLHAKILIS